MEKPASSSLDFAKALRKHIGLIQDFPGDLPAQIDDIIALISAPIEQAHAFLLDPGDTNSSLFHRSLYLNFFWVNAAKSFLLLFRDTLFQQQKADILLLEKQITPEGQQKLRQLGRETLENAAAQLIEEEEQAGLDMSPEEIRHCKLQHNPWPVYKSQFSEIGKQVHRVEKDHAVLLQVAHKTADIRELFEQMIQSCREEVHALKAMIQETRDTIGQLFEAEQSRSVGKVAARMPEYQATIQETDYLKILETTLEEAYEALPGRHNVVLGLEEGLLETDELDFRRQTKTWVKAELLPQVYEIWELTDLRRKSAQMTLLNVRNWALTLSDRKEAAEELFRPEEILQLFEELESGTQAALDNLIQIQELTAYRIGTFLQAYRAYSDHRPYLPIEVQSTLGQLRSRPSRALKSLSNFYQKQTRRVRSLLKRLEREESLSQSEKIIRRIRERTGDPENQAYTSIFLTKGFVGTSFTVGREEELSHAAQIVANWRKGYRGSILITGERYAGKSLFAELVTTRLFPDATIRLEANSVLTVAGRKFATNYDLGTALDNIRKYKDSEKSVILIEDLESWWTDKFPVHDNARKLARFANLYNNHFFLVVTMGNSLLAHLEQHVDLLKEFQAGINMDRVSTTMIREAILVRHGATHKKLVNAKGEVLSPQQFRRLTSAIYSESRGNIGEALNLWALSTWKVDDESVTNRFEKGHDLPDFLESDLGILLAAIMLLRHSNEFQLRHMFGPAFTSRYAPVVRRLLGIGVLERELNGDLEINPVLVNRLGQILQRQGYLKYTP